MALPPDDKKKSGDKPTEAKPSARTTPPPLTKSAAYSDARKAAIAQATGRQNKADVKTSAAGPASSSTSTAQTGVTHGASTTTGKIETKVADSSTTRASVSRQRGEYPEVKGSVSGKSSAAATAAANVDGRTTVTRETHTNPKNLAQPATKTETSADTKNEVKTITSRVDTTHRPARPERGPDRGPIRDSGRRGPPPGRRSPPPDYRPVRAQGRPGRKMGPPPGSSRKGAIVRRGRPVPQHVIHPATAHDGSPWGPLLIGLLLLAGVAWYAVKYYTPQIESDLARRSNEALSGEGLVDANVTIDGRTAVLSGAVENNDQKKLAEQTVAGTFGVRAVDNQLSVGTSAASTADPRTQPSFSLTKTGDSIEMTGTVSDKQYAAAMEEAANAHFGADRVNASITVEPGTTNPGWMSAINQLVPELDKVENGALSIENDTLTLTGASDADTKTQIGTLATELTAGQLQVENLIEAPEPVVETKPEPAVEAEPAAEPPEPAAEPEPAAAPKPAAEAEPAAEPEPVVKAEPQVEAEPVVEPEPKPEPEPVAEPEIPKLPAFAAIRDSGDGVTVNGFMSAEGAEQLLTALGANKPVTNNISVDDRVETPEWTAQLGDSLNALSTSGVANPGVTMTRAGSIKMRGVVESEEAKTAAGVAISDVYGDEYEIANDLEVVVPPPVPTLSPFASVSSADNTVTITGLLPPATAKSISSTYRAAGKSVIENVTRDERVIEPEWSDAFAQVAGSMDGVENQSVIVNSSGDVTLKGTVEDDSTKQAAGDSVTSLFGDSVSLRNDIQVTPTIVPADELSKLFDSIDLSGIRFASNSAELTESSIGILDQVVDALTTIPGVDVEISGHTDSAGSYDYNLALSAQRAETVTDYLADKGIDSDRLESKGFGPSRPVASNETRAGRALNRRIEFKISGE